MAKVKLTQKNTELEVIDEMLPEDVKNLKKFLSSTTALNWAKLVTGLISTDKSALLSAAGRIGQAAFKGKIFEQLGKEVFELTKAGMIKDDYLESELGRSAFVDMLKFIDEENPDEIRFKAIKSIFFSTVASDSDENSRRRAYYIFREARVLTSMDVLVLKVCYKIYQKDDSRFNSVSSAGDWVNLINAEVGLGLETLIVKADEHLSTLGFISTRQLGDKSGVQRGRNFRLTTGLGLPFCELIEKFE